MQELSRSRKGLVFGIFVGLILGIAITINFGGSITKNIRSALILWRGDIINFNEVIESEKEGEKLIEVMNQTGIKISILTGAPKEIIYFNNQAGFSNYDQNNQTILNVSQKYPNRFIAFCTINPADTDKLSKLQECLKKGAKGLRLFSGHSLSYNKDYPLDEESMKYVYRFLEEQSLPVIFHVNLYNYRSEFERVLNQFPKLKTVCPHFCLHSTKLSELGLLLDKYPNLYLDISFGYKAFILEGFERISQNPTNFRDFITKYQDRIVFGTDVVITGYEGKEVGWIAQVYQGYKDFLEKDKFRFFLKNDPAFEYNGLGLDPNILEKIYRKNAAQLFAPAK